MLCFLSSCRTSARLSMVGGGQGESMGSNNSLDTMVE